MSDKRSSPPLEDDAKERISLMLRHRLPWLLVGLGGGILATFVSSRFEPLLQKNLHLAFFIPVIVYMADAVGTQTQSVYVRNLGRGKVSFITYLIKESLLGLVLGALLGAILGLLAYLWYNDAELGIAVGLSMFGTILIAPIFALLVPAFFQKEHTDPALMSGPFTTIIQDLLSLLIYLLVSTFILLG